MDDQTVKIRIINPRREPLRLAEFALRDQNGVWQSDESGQLKHSKEFFKGDIAEVSKPTALHLIATGEAELEPGQVLSAKHNGEGA